MLYEVITCVGHIRGGLAMASVLACMIFAAVSGSSPATVAAIGSIAIGAMVRAGYPEAMAAGVIANAGTLGILIPPSIVMLVYCAATNVSAAKLFMAGFFPGIALGLCIMVAIYVVAWQKNRITSYNVCYTKLLRLSYKSILSPITGIVSQVTAQEGETVVSGFQVSNLITVLDPSRLEMWIYVDETDVGQVKPGMPVEFRVDAYPDTVFTGEVDTIYRNNVV